MRQIFILFIFAFACFANAQNSPVQNQTTGNFYSTIQTAIDSAINGDILIADTGIYYESINFYGKNVVLASKYYITGDTSFVGNTIINSDTLGSALTYTSGEDSTCKVIGFTITSQSGTLDTNFANPVGFVVYAVNSAPKFEYCWFRNTKLTYSVNAQTVYSSDSELKFENCLFEENEEVFYVNAGKLQLENCDLKDNYKYLINANNAELKYKNCNFDWHDYNDCIQEYSCSSEYSSCILSIIADLHIGLRTTGGNCNISNSDIDGYGQYMYSYNSNVSFYNVSMTGQASFNEPAIWFSGSQQDTLRLNKCFFFGRSGLQIYTDDGNIFINKSTITYNSSGWYCGGLASQYSKVFITNSVVLNNYQAMDGYENNIFFEGVNFYARNSAFRNISKQNTIFDVADCNIPEGDIIDSYSYAYWLDPYVKYKWNSKTIDGGKAAITINGVLCSDLDSSDYLGDAPDMGFHEFVFEPSSDYDIAIHELLSPVGDNLGLSNNEKISFSVFNNGILDISEFSVSYSINNQIDSSFLVSSLIPSGEFREIEFPNNLNFSEPKQYNLTLVVSLANDTNLHNDSLHYAIFSGTEISSFPYYEDFENGTAGWIPEGYRTSWELGQSNFYSTWQNFKQSSPNMWATNLNGSANSNEKSYVLSPVFDFSNLVDPILKFDFTSGSHSDGYDAMSLQYSTDNEIWQQLGQIGDTGNWYNTENNYLLQLDTFQNVNQAWDELYWEWYNASYSIDFLAGEELVRFKFVYTNSFLGNNSSVSLGVSFDNFEVYDLDTTSSSIVLESFSKINIYPNPAKEAIFLEANNIRDSKISMFSVEGKEIDFTVSRISDSQLVIDIRKIYPGLYFIKVEDHENCMVKKHLIQK